MTAVCSKDNQQSTPIVGHQTRAYAPHQPTWQRFHEFAAPLLSTSGAGTAVSSSSSSQHHPYSRQYSHVYSARLAGLRERCVTNAKKALRKLCTNGDGGSCEWSEENVDVVDRIIEVKEGVWSILVGTIVKEVDPKRRPPVDSSYHSLNAYSFLFPSSTKDAKDAKGEDAAELKQEFLRSHLFDSEKGDVLHLEDESGRVELTPITNEGQKSENKNNRMIMIVDASTIPSNDGIALNPNEVATGVVAAVVGKVSAEKGVMQVHSIHFAGPPSLKSKKNDSSIEVRGTLVDDEEVDEPVLLLVSGLGCGSDSPVDAITGGSLALRREMLMEYLVNSNLGNGSSICRVIVAGGGIAPPEVATDDSSSIANKENINHGKNKRSKNGQSDSNSGVVFSLRELDLFFTEILSCGIPIDYIPGMHDPTNGNWPQRPIHSCLLPHSCSFLDLFGRSTNPYEGLLGVEKGQTKGGVRVLGSDGLNVADLRRFLAINVDDASDDKEGESCGKAACRQSATSSIDALHQTFRYGHMAPTGPDSLPTFPSSESDPFVFQTKPAIYFAGNCDKFETRLVDANGEEIQQADAMDVDGEKGVSRLVCIPNFAITGEVVLVKLRTLECEIVSFIDVGA